MFFSTRFRSKTRALRKHPIGTRPDAAHRSRALWRFFVRISYGVVIHSANLRAEVIRVKWDSPRARGQGCISLFGTVVLIGTFSLTPALSRRERENARPPSSKIGHRLHGTPLQTIRERCFAVPLPAGEGQGEGEAFNSRRVLISSDAYRGQERE
jgi:hypothetical protein